MQVGPTSDKEQPTPAGKQDGQINVTLDSGPSTHAIIDVLDATESPPEFTSYEAEYFHSDEGDVISHDYHLNEDGEALHRFLLAHSAAYPSLILHCDGTHRESRTRMVSRRVNGTTRSRIERYTVTVQDFLFSVDLSKHIVIGPVHWSFADSEPTYRGLMVRQVQDPVGRRKATEEEIHKFKHWEHERKEKGLPPWASHGSKHELDMLLSSQTLRQWADEYCASPKLLKEFVYKKFVHGRDMHALEAAIRTAISQTSYRGSVDVRFKLSSAKISVRADNKLSRALSKTVIRYLLVLLLVYPFIWLFKRFHSRGGGRWEVCGGAYALKHMEPIGAESSFSPSTVEGGKPAPPPRIVDTPNGQVRVFGLREGEWFREWESMIRKLVDNRVQSSKPMQDLSDAPGGGS